MCHWNNKGPLKVIRALFSFLSKASKMPDLRVAFGKPLILTISKPSSPFGLFIWDAILKAAKSNTKLSQLQLDLRWSALLVLSLSKTPQSKERFGECWVFHADLHSLTYNSRVAPPPLTLLPMIPGHTDNWALLGRENFELGVTAVLRTSKKLKIKEHIP